MFRGSFFVAVALSDLAAGSLGCASTDESSDKLRTLREEAGLSQVQMAKLHHAGPDRLTAGSAARTTTRSPRRCDHQ